MNNELTISEDIAYLNLSADPAVFEGDGEMEYQYDIYRHMRGEVLFSDPTITTAQKQPQAGQKSRRKAKTNTTTEQQEALAAPNEAEAAAAWRAYNPATNLIWLHFVLYHLMTVIEPPRSMGVYGRANEQLAKELYKRLSLLNEEKLTMESLKKREWSSAGEMVAWSVGKGWLDEGDVVGAGCGRGV